MGTWFMTGRYRPARTLVHAAPVLRPLALLLLSLLLWGSAGGAQAQTRTIVAFGDSLMAGYGLAQGDGFAPQLERALRAAGEDVRVVAAGVSGDTSAGGRQRIAWTLDNLPQRPDLVIVELGANDMLRGIDPKETLRNLDAILAEIRARGIDVLLAGMLAAPNLGEERARYFNSIYPFLANRHDVPLYPFFLRGVALRRDLLMPDMMHPNAAGVAVIVGNILPSVRAELRQPLD